MALPAQRSGGLVSSESYNIHTWNPLPYKKKIQRICANLRRGLNVSGGGGGRTQPAATPLGGKGWEGRGADSVSCPRAHMTLATPLVTCLLISKTIPSILTKLYNITKVLLRYVVTKQL